MLSRETRTWIPCNLFLVTHAQWPTQQHGVAEPHLTCCTQVFATPKRQHKSKPFFDHVISFAVADGRIWMRNYQVGRGCKSRGRRQGAGSARVHVGSDHGQ